jgi:predicted lipoprotein with Yx(FWY)xxD motif
MFLISAACNGSRQRSVRQLVAAGAPVALAIVVAGCGSNSTTTTKSASHESTSMSHTSTGMSMAGGGPMTEMMMMAAARAEVTAGSSPHYGRVLYDSHHLALYVFSADRGSASTCYGACSKAWPPMLTKGPPRVAGLNASLLGTTKRRNGSLQVTFAGHPLYYWSGDTAHTIMCQHVRLHGGFWYVVDPNGSANTAKGVGTMSAMG